MITARHAAMLLLLRRLHRDTVTLCTVEDFDVPTTALTRPWEQKWVWGEERNFMSGPWLKN